MEYFYSSTVPQMGEGEANTTQHTPWRTKDKLKIVNGGVLMCLNLGTPPPDVVKPKQCATMQAWFDPTHFPQTKALEVIARNVNDHYMRCQPKLKLKVNMDPTADDVKRLCTSIRRKAKDEPCLLHYNGHGVPRPTTNGEIWVFNKTFTQYIPVSLIDLHSWLGGPTLMVYDCNAAGLLVRMTKLTLEQIALQESSRGSTAPPTGAESAATSIESRLECIQLASCSENESLPTIPDLPADLFTSCLTTPIETALLWAYINNKLTMPDVTYEMVEAIPGTLADRRTVRGQLNWIFTAITDTIAWTVLPPDVFTRLFRSDLLVAALFRNFLLADRIMRSVGCTPVSSPALPATHDHPLWQSWDIAVDSCLSQLPRILQPGEEPDPLTFFADQLTAFEVWLDFNAINGKDKNPEQLPIVLQVLLSQQHRLRALELLDRFMGLGSWAVYSALTVGIFPYVFKLLSSPAMDTRAVLTSIWAKILFVDKQCKEDLLKSPGASSSKRPGERDEV